MKSLSRILAALVVISMMPVALAVPGNIVNVTEDVAVELQTSDTAVLTSLILKQGSLFSAMNIQTSTMLVSVAAGGTVVLEAPAGQAMVMTPATGAGFTLMYPCSSQSAILTATDFVEIAVTVKASGTGSCTAAVTPPSSGGGGGGGFAPTPSMTTGGGEGTTTSEGGSQRSSAPSNGNSNSSFAPIPSDCFTDTSRNVYGSQICDLKARGLVEGYQDKTFKPMGLINRAEFVHLLMKALVKYRGEAEVVLPLADRDCFADVPAEEWYANSVCQAKARGLVSGYTATEFGPDRSIIFPEALAIFLRARGDELPAATEPWFVRYMTYIRKTETDPMLTKTRTFHELTRAETAHILVLLFPVMY